MSLDWNLGKTVLQVVVVWVKLLQDDFQFDLDSRTRLLTNDSHVNNSDVL